MPRKIPQAIKFMGSPGMSYIPIFLTLFLTSFPPFSKESQVNRTTGTLIFYSKILTKILLFLTVTKGVQSLRSLFPYISGKTVID
jgi:hypothetical protein